MKPLTFSYISTSAFKLCFIFLIGVFIFPQAILADHEPGHVTPDIGPIEIRDGNPIWKPLIVCGTEKTKPECGFNDLVTLAQNLITDLIIISTFLAAIAFAYAGFILLASGGNENQKNRAKDIFKKVLIGYLWILGAWLLVYTITDVLLDKNAGYSILGAPQ